KVLKKLVSKIYESSFGLGPITPLMNNEDITEIMINNHDSIYYEIEGKLFKSEITFRNNLEVKNLVDKILNPLGLRLDESCPMVDARTKDGSRINAVSSPVNINDISVTIRKFSKNIKDIDILVCNGTLNREMANFIKALVEKKVNIILTGATSTGKTTMLNMLSSFIPSDERIITIEDTIELDLKIQNVVKLESKPPNIEGKGEITIRDLVKNSLRMRPDRIIVGEVRGCEIIDVLQAMNTGHKGSMTTVHANSSYDLISRLETMLIMAGPNISFQTARNIILSSVEIIIFLERLAGGERIVSKISAIDGLRKDKENIFDLDIKDIFMFDKKKYHTSKARINDCFVFTGYLPENLQ
ncbi:CpaF family protein, partial [bacterium]|nr:CpaF family protein [bacterium]